jgi:glycerol-3-phosphate dehydrogenase
LPGALGIEDRDAMLEDLGAAFGASTATRLWQTYGGASSSLLQGTRQRPELAQRLGPNSDLIVGELMHAIEREHAQTLVDLLLRRTMFGLGADLGKASAPLAADWLVRLGVWDKAKAGEEVAAYRRYSRRYAVPIPSENSDQTR